MLLTKLAIGIYLYQLVLIQQADISELVHATQHKLAQLKSLHTLGGKIALLQMPVWTFFYWNKSMLEKTAMRFIHRAGCGNAGLHLHSSVAVPEHQIREQE